MKPHKNPEEIYLEAIKLEQNRLKEMDIPVRLKQDPTKWVLRIGSFAAGIAAAVLIAWFLIYPKTEQNRAEMAKNQLSGIVIPSNLINTKGEIMPVERFNTSVKNITADNETIDRFNQKMKKFKKSNS